MLDTKKIGEQIVTLRKEKGLTADKLSEILEISPQAVSKWETGKNLPETSILPKLAEVLGCSVDEMLKPKNLHLNNKSMNHRLILIEGIPGSGKTLLSEKLANHISRNYIKANLWHEGGYHPANLIDWTAIVPLAELGKIVAAYPDYEEKIRENMYIDGDYAILFTKFHIPKKDRGLLDLMGRHGMGRRFELYTSLHINKWRKFAKIKNDNDNPKKDEITIFECAYLQEHIESLMMWMERSETEIIDYMKKLIDAVISLNPLLIYLQQKDVRETIKRVSESKLHEDGWAERVSAMYETAPYGKTHNLKGFDGIVEFFTKKKEIDYTVINELPIKTIFIDNDDYDWDAVWQKMKEEIDIELKSI